MTKAEYDFRIIIACKAFEKEHHFSPDNVIIQQSTFNALLPYMSSSNIEGYIKMYKGLNIEYYARNNEDYLCLCAKRNNIVMRIT